MTLGNGHQGPFLTLYCSFTYEEYDIKKKQELDPILCARCILDSYRSGYTGFNKKDVRVDEKPQEIVICKIMFPLIDIKHLLNISIFINHE